MPNKIDLIFAELSYKIIGCLFDVYNELGAHHKEIIYQKALAAAFSQAGLKYKQQLYAEVLFQDKKIGSYYFDFLVEEKVVLEIKHKDRLSKVDYDQIKKYLQTNNLKLGLLANFSNHGLIYKRVANIH